ncbi:hypothetical protein BHE74_00015993 [Ensete ventricosum]|uniref:Uncharacterized protein n=1 Tax=Ensete ventricosum TaxID=4639 RepID=A0A445MGT9_ENSVE|nr:hypothetical protein BHE74_00015993 [Ensete ventricosum]RZR73416.1 hypothetical protein BHM03_00023843 [Ensete ventricosum]
MRGKANAEKGGGRSRRRVDRSSRLPAEALVHLEYSADQLLRLECLVRTQQRGSRNAGTCEDRNRNGKVNRGGFLLMSKGHRMPTVRALCGLTNPWKRVGRTQSKPVVCKTAHRLITIQVVTMVPNHLGVLLPCLTVAISITNSPDVLLPCLKVATTIINSLGVLLLCLNNE